MTTDEQIAVLRAYSAGRLGTREAIARAGLDDFADLLIALGHHDLPLPGPEDTPQRRENVERARVLLEPLLRVDAA